MLSPSDLEARARFGDETVATTADDDQPDAPKTDGSLFNNLRPPHTYEPQEVPSLAAGAVHTVTVAYQPDFWLVTVPKSATTAIIEVSYGPTYKSTPDAELEYSGYCRIPGRGTQLTLRNVGAGAGKPTVVACGGWGELNSGDILIVPG